ncbi:MAG: hypothetical protein CVU57_12065 [Deltaproteobacteria bacterium HGW-Deltaproteobacteria-15]|jgi:hypothetical protein|nr:MAG: hypothetical protein CVU57_12065 [Deltaproteobacteria bacterium HGW-Deltaproteobacteria-15]
MQTAKCLLHIGAPKTGSTALEKFLANNRNTLAQLGWQYPDVSLRGFGHHDFAFLIGGGYPEWAIPQARPLEELVQDLKMSLTGAPGCIMSSENFFLLPNPRGVAEILSQANFPPGDSKIVVYVRRQDEAHISWYNQVVKAQGYTGAITECIAENRDLWNYADRLKSWEEVFGRDNLVVRPYQAGDLLENDIRADFLSVAGLTPEHFNWHEEPINTRINADILRFQRSINRLPLSYPEKRRFHKQLIALTAATKDTGLFDDSPLLSTKQRKEILSTYAASNAEVARTYLGRERLFKEDIPDAPEPIAGEEGLTMDKLIYILGWILLRRDDV